MLNKRLLASLVEFFLQQDAPLRNLYLCRSQTLNSLCLDRSTPQFGGGTFIIQPAIQSPASLLLLHTAPLFEKEGNLHRPALTKN